MVIENIVTLDKNFAIAIVCNALNLLEFGSPRRNVELVNAFNAMIELAKRFAFLSTASQRGIDFAKVRVRPDYQLSFLPPPAAEEA